ncbi:MAG TPA: tol-pal system protein YbgF [bacterium]|nr:tol-pal system protein YbgF [bacterium]
MNRVAVTALTLCLVLAAGAASAKSPEDRIKALEQQITALQRTYTANAADTVSAVESMKGSADEISAMKGQVEATSRILQAQREEFMRFINDLQARITVIEERMGVFSSQVTSAIGKVNPAAGAEATAYQQALDLANGGRYLEAAGAFEAFLQKYPKSQWAGSARYWVAESFYLSRDYKRAIKEFQVFIEKFPKEPKIAEAILKQGNSFYELGLLEESRAFYEKVASSYPSSKEGQAAKARIKRLDEKKKGGAAPAAETTAGHGETIGSPLTAYPSETIEQQRAKMEGKGLPPPVITPQQEPNKSKPQRIGPSAKEF